MATAKQPSAERLVDDSAARRRLRPPRVADMVADRLRDRILASGMPDGALLPKQEDLIAEFQVSLQSVREALRILETEGLVTVLRGNTGGAAVRMPSAEKVGYMAALVLQARAVGVEDVARALQQLEPACAGLAAARPDREGTVVADLRLRLEESREALDDGDTYVRIARQFHEDLVAGCGNETMILLVGALESLWSAHVDTLVREAASFGPFAERAVREKTLEDHQQLLEAISAGDVERSQRLAGLHLAEPERHAFVSAGSSVRASLLRDR
jgi:GntR family transcriptional regulator, transcriptional repressor for pyruvate dehydrogenase complex